MLSSVIDDVIDILQDLFSAIEVKALSVTLINCLR